MARTPSSRQIGFDTDRDGLAAAIAERAPDSDIDGRDIDSKDINGN
jgi:hypothetical protein